MCKSIGIVASQIVFIIVMAVGSAFATVPQYINYQGNLTDSGGVPITATVSMVFSIYDVASGGTALWTETQSVQVSQGLYSVTLGSVTSINLPFDSQYYLGVKVGTDAEMTPRQTLTSVAYSYRAEIANSAVTVTNGVYTNGSYADPAWITSLAGSKITGTISATTATTATNFSGSLSGDVTGTQGTTVVSQVGGETSANVAAGAALANNATNTNTASRIVKRDASGNFTAGTITANLTGNVTGNVSGNAGTVTNGIYTSGSYADPAWITSLAGSKISGNISGNAATVTNGVYANAANAFTTQAPITLNPFNTAAGNTGELRFKELAANGTDYVAIKAPDSIAANATFILPATDGTSGQVLKTDGSGNLGWVSAGSGTVTSVATGTGLSGGPITGSGTISLANTAVTAGSYTRANITVDSQGRLTAAANGSAVDLGTADVTGSLPDSKLATISTAGKVANSATTATNANTASAIVARDGSGNFSAGTISASLTGNVTGNVSGTAANVTGTVAIANGGTGATTAANAINGLLPSQTGNSGKFLTTDGSAASWGTPSGGSSFSSAAVVSNTSGTSGWGLYTVTATCAGGKYATGGGCQSLDPGNDMLGSSYPTTGTPPTAWKCEWWAGGNNQNLTAYVICMP